MTFELKGPLSSFSRAVKNNKKEREIIRENVRQQTQQTEQKRQKTAPPPSLSVCDFGVQA